MYRRVTIVFMPKGLEFINLILLVLLLSSNVKSQTFERLYETDFDDMSVSAVEVDNSFIIAVNSGDYFNMSYAGKYLKLDKQGNITDSVNIPIPNGFKFFQSRKFFKLNNDTILSINDIINNKTDNHGFQIVHLTNNMKIAFDTVVYDTLSIVYLDYYLTEDQTIITTGAIEIADIFFIKITDIYGNLLEYQSYSNIQSGFYPSTLIEIPQENTIYVFIYWSNEDLFYKINKETLQIDDILNYPNSFYPNNAINGVYDSSFYVGGTQNAFLYNGVRELSFVEISNSGNIIKQNNYLISPDTNTFYYYNSFSKCNGKLFLGGTYNFKGTPPPEFYPEQRWIFINKLNPDGSIIWQRFYKGDVNYMTYKVLATTDGGALILSGRYDWNDPVPYQRDLHILKVDSTGWYDGMTTGETQYDQPKQILVYPNPVKDKVTFVTGFYNNLELSIYNLQGKPVLKQKLPYMQTIDISALPKGLYVYIITGENGFIEKGKLSIAH